MDEMLGKPAKDKITGLQGIITAKVVYVSGCIQYCIQPPIDKDGKLVESNYFDEGRIEIVSSEKIEAGVDPPGGPVESNVPREYRG